MGSGKTTSGRKLANLLQYDFIDTDQALEERTGVSVTHIFEIEGESGFREREAKLLADLCKDAQPTARGVVIATGGGIILREDNCALMRESGTVIYLRASKQLLWARLKDARNRPLLNTPDPKGTVEQLLETRDPLYIEEADLIVDIDNESSNKTANKIHALLQP